jgi:8-oxo-dGTP pyrophosphatase MutT (NUDIX family)
VLREFPLDGRTAERVDAEGRAVHPSPPVRDAATVMLVRDRRTGATGGPSGSTGPGAVEVFAFRRVPRMAFAAGMLVFPGGAVDAGDADPGTPWAGAPPEQDAAAVAAAVRETFEECGVLLARDADGRPPDAADLAAGIWQERRLALAAGSVTLTEVLTRARLTVCATDLRPWARWVTPPFESRRFDTRFYVAALPAGQEARDLGGEGEQAAWLDPRAALAAHQAGELPMLPPTLVCLEDLAAPSDVAGLLATPREPRPVSPWVARRRDGELVLRIDLDGRGGGETRP